MKLGIIILVGSEHGTPIGNWAAGKVPLECLEILGKSMLERQIERFMESDPAVITVLVKSGTRIPVNSCPVPENVKIRRADDLWFATSMALREYCEIGVQQTIIANADTYTECDILDLVYFHQESRRVVTGTSDSVGPLGLWVADCDKARVEPLDFLLGPPRLESSSYFVWNYTHRLKTLADVRKLVVDSLQRRCAVRPAAPEVRPGVFIAEGAQVHKRARIVAPAFVGRDSRIREDALITRCSNIESDCYIDCSTAVEDSSILSNTYVGLCLDVAHSVVQGDLLLNVQRNVELRIVDANVVRENVFGQSAAVEAAAPLS
ncbi:MAG TPA: hypothetical protein VI386_29065 [Candidatus Sulfotelmatobacter sp.]